MSPFKFFGLFLYSSFRTKCNEERNLPTLALQLNDMHKGGSVYIMTNKHRNVLYIGVTSNLPVRIQQHKSRVFRNSFTDKYNIEFLIYHETFFDIESAIAREKEIKKWRREKKNELINQFNSKWIDLTDSLY